MANKAFQDDLVLSFPQIQNQLLSKESWILLVEMLFMATVWIPYFLHFCVPGILYSSRCGEGRISEIELELCTWPGRFCASSYIPGPSSRSFETRHRLLWPASSLRSINPQRNEPLRQRDTCICTTYSSQDRGQAGCPWARWRTDKEKVVYPRCAA